MHTCDNSNGIIYYNELEALIVSTPPSDDATETLIQWVTDSLKKNIVAYVIDRWHPDAMEGLDIVHKHGIPSYAYEVTQEIAIAKNLPVPYNGFSPQLTIPIGKDSIHCEYFGKAHTKDGIVVYIPSEKVLFGGNEVRNYNGWVGNIADANLYEWTNTIQKVESSFPDAEIVVPGHGRPGGSELLDYTIELYSSFSSPPEINMNSSSMVTFGEDNLNVQFGVDTLINNQRVLKDATLNIWHQQRAFSIKSSVITIPSPGKYRSDTGIITILYPTGPETCLEITAKYEGLFIDLRNDEIGITIVLRSLNP